MSFSLFFRRWMSKDEKITFFAAVFATMTVTVQNLGSVQISAYRQFSDFLDLNESDESIFSSRLNDFIGAYYRGDIDINYLIGKIDKFSKKNRGWIEEIPLEAIKVCVVRDEILQRRFVEYIMTLLKESSMNR